MNLDYLREPASTFLVAIALGLLIGVVASEEQRVILFSVIAIFLFSALVNM